MAVLHLHTGIKDNRYTVAKEYCGYKDKKCVARFCGEWIGCADTPAEAWIMAQEHYDNHRIDSVV